MESLHFVLPDTNIKEFRDSTTMKNNMRNVLGVVAAVAFAFALLGAFLAIGYVKAKGQEEDFREGECKARKTTKPPEPLLFFVVFSGRCLVVSSELEIRPNCNCRCPVARVQSNCDEDFLGRADGVLTRFHGEF